MSYINKHRKCAKCGKTRDEDMTVSYHRFPKPGLGNMKKASAWAKFCYPNEDWTSLEFLNSLYKKNKVLCGRHFHSSQFYDSMRQNLNKFAVPDADEVQDFLNDRENLFDQTVQHLADPGPSRPSTSTKGILPLVEIQPALPQQSSVAVQRKSEESSGQALQLSTTEPSKLSIHGHLPISADQASVTASCSKQKTAKQRKKEGILRQLNVTKSSELTDRENKLYNICQKKLRQINRLRKQLKKKKLNVIEKLSVNENVQELCNLKLSNSFITLLQSQIQNCPKKPKGRRYSLEQKIMALIMYKKSPACYRLLRRMFALPGQTSLNKLLNRVPLKPGINKHIFLSLKEMADKHTVEENVCLLLFDEMSIRRHLHYDSRQDEILGFQDHGNHGRSSEVATKALVFMLTGLRKKWKQPIAFYFTHSLNADRMTVILKEILAECSKTNIDIVGTVCDLSTVNIKVLKTLGATCRDPYFEYLGREYVAVLDPPHLLKCTRNLMLKHNVECTTNMQCNDVIVKGTAKWSHIEAFYSSDKNNTFFVYAPALTDQHINPNTKQQMRVKLAAQVFSHSVAAGILAKIASNDLPAEAHATANFVKKFDDLFDAVNADSPDLRRGKKFSTNLTAHSPHISLFNEMRKFISSMNYIGAKNKPPSQEGWIHSLNAIERLWKNVQKRNIKSIATRRLNQDALENCFGCIRYNCGSNNNPTIQQFVAGIKTAIITNLRNTGQNTNCEDDTAVLDNNLKTFLVTNFEEQGHLQKESPENVELETIIADAVETVDEATSESQACAYVSGFIFKKLKNNNCQDCRMSFLTDNLESIHVFTNIREYDEHNKALVYANKSFVLCVEQCASLINNYLNNNAFKAELKSTIVSLLDCIDFSFLNKCQSHMDENINHIKFSTFFICIKRYIMLRNRDMEEDEKNKAFQRKIQILKNK